MIDSRQKLSFYIKADAIMNDQVFPHGWVKRLLFPSLIERFLRVMRKLEYYDIVKKTNPLGLIPYVYYRRRYERLKERTGFDIPPHTFGYGVRIAHLSTIVINGATKIGNYCCLSNNIVFADAQKKIIGNDVFIGSNVVFAKETTVADGCKISACTLQNTCAKEVNMLGVISKPLKKTTPWTHQEPYREEKDRVEALRRKME